MPRQPQPLSRIGRTRPEAGHLGSRSRASLLSIPLELREEIYYHLTYPDSKTLIDLLVVNRRLAREVKPFLYKQPLSFDGQSELFQWLGQVDHDYLRYVADIRFKLVDIDPENIVGALGKRLREAGSSQDTDGSDGTDNPYYEACYQDLKRLQRAFSLLHSVRKFTIVERTPSDSQPPSRMIDGFTKMLSHCFPELQTLISEEKSLPIVFIANKPYLRRIRFPANTESSEDDIAAIFTHLPDLRLEVCRLPSLEGIEYHSGCMAEILPHVPPLRSLTLFENIENLPPGLLEEVFVDSIEAMKRHLRSLRKLKIMANPPPTPQEASTMKRNLLRFLEASHLRHVEVYGTYASIYRHLPGTVETFVLRLDKPCTPQRPFIKALNEFMLHVKYRAVTASKDPQIPRLSKLREIQVWVAEPLAQHSAEDDDDSDEDGDEDDDRDELVESCKSTLRKIGVVFSLVVHSASCKRMTGSEDVL